MPGTFYIPLPRRRPIPGVDCEAPNNSNHESIERSQVERKPYIYSSIKLDAFLENNLIQTFTGLVLIDYSHRGPLKIAVSGFSSFDDVRLILSRLQQMRVSG